MAKDIEQRHTKGSAGGPIRTNGLVMEPLFEDCSAAAPGVRFHSQRTRKPPFRFSANAGLRPDNGEMESRNSGRSASQHRTHAARLNCATGHQADDRAMVMPVPNGAIAHQCIPDGCP
jgi:hypothetical protein